MTHCACRRRTLGPAAAAFALASVLGLAACGGALFQSKVPPPAVYQLTVKSAAAPGALSSVAEIPADLSILRPRVRTGLDNDRIAALYPDRRLDYLAGARWSGPLDEVLQDLALQAFRARANLRSVHAEQSAFAGGYLLTMDVVDFQAEYSADAGGADAPTVHVRLLASLGGARDRRMIGRFEAEARRPAAANRVAAIVEAYDQAVAEALAHIVEDSVSALNASLAKPR